MGGATLKDASMACITTQLAEAAATVKALQEQLVGQASADSSSVEQEPTCVQSLLFTFFTPTHPPLKNAYRQNTNLENDLNIMIFWSQNWFRHWFLPPGGRLQRTFGIWT